MEPTGNPSVPKKEERSRASGPPGVEHDVAMGRRAVAELLLAGIIQRETLAFLVEVARRSSVSAAVGRPYGRRVLCHDATGEAMIAAWGPGSRSAPHDHGGAQGRVIVVSGRFEERVHPRLGATRAARAALGPPSEPRTWQEGDMLTVALDVVHDMTSLDVGGVTLHVYAGATGAFSVYDVARRETLRASGGAWLPPDEVLAREAWEPA